MTGRAARAWGWAAVVALLELVGRAVAYGLSAQPSLALRAQLGGPRLAVVALVALALAGVLSAGIVWIAAVGVQERWRLASRAAAGPRPERPSLAALARRAAVLWVAGCVVFACVENYLHWRAGLGFHGLACLTGPVHRDAIPIIGALAIVAAAAGTAAGHVLGWMRRTIGRVVGRTATPLRVAVRMRPRALVARSTSPLAGLGARAPPPRCA